MINEEVMEKFPQVEEIVTTVHKPGSPIPGILDDVSVTIKKKDRFDGLSNVEFIEKEFLYYLAGI